MKLRTAPYLQQQTGWPSRGRHILAQHDDARVVVYQAFRPSVAEYSAMHGTFGGEFSLSRMSWIKTNFLWMMYRCGWATKEGQERVVAVSLQRAAFDRILEEAVSSSYDRRLYPDQREWQTAVSRSTVRLQWDPDHAPYGARQERRAIQLGLRGEMLEQYAREWIIEIEDVTPFVREQHQHVVSGRLEELLTPLESVYRLPPPLAARIGADPLLSLPPETMSPLLPA